MPKLRSGYAEGGRGMSVVDAIGLAVVSFILGILLGEYMLGGRG